MADNIVGFLGNKPTDLIASDWVGEKDSPLIWKSMTLGQNEKIQNLAKRAADASEFLTVNLELASTTITVAGAFLKASLNPTIILLNAVADEIDNFVSDFKNIGFYVLEVGQPGTEYKIPTTWNSDTASWENLKVFISPLTITTNMAIAATKGLSLEFAGYASEVLLEDNIYLTGAQKSKYEIPVGGQKKAWISGACLSGLHATKEECEKAHPNSKFGWYEFGGRYGGWDASGAGTSPAESDQLGEIDNWTGLNKLRPSEALATMAAALDDQYDKRRPVFSTSAEAGGIVLMVGIADLTKNLATIADVLSAIMTFFGGEKQGFLAGMGKINNLIKAALLELETPNKNAITLKVTKICEMIGTEEDQEKMQEGNYSPTLYTDSGKFAPYNSNKRGDTSRNFIFKEGDFILGPHSTDMLTPALGYVSKVIKNKDGESASYSDPEGFATQELEIIPLTAKDAIHFKNSKGREISKVHYYKKEWNILDSWGWTKLMEANSFKWPEELGYCPTGEHSEASECVAYSQNTSGDSPDAIIQQTSHKWVSAKEAMELGQWYDGSRKEYLKIGTQVVRESGEQWPKITGNDNMFQDITFSAIGSGEEGGSGGAGTVTYLTRICGTVTEKGGEPKEGPAPNFTSVKLEDILGDLDKLFSGIQALTDGMRKIGADMTKKIDEIILFLNEKIIELEELNAALQKILKVFAEGLPATGIYALNIPVNVGGNEYLKNSLMGAANAPPDSLDFTMSMFIAFGGPGKKLQELLVPED